MRFFLLVPLVLAATTVPADAQIFTWRDAAGQLVLSNTAPPRDTTVTTYAVPGAPGLRTATRPASQARRSAYDDLIREHADRHGISPDLVRAVIQAESGFNRFAVSKKGAMGLMQLMPATARELGVKNPFQPDENIRAGVWYLATLLERFDFDVVRALAAYNAGPHRVEQYNGVPPYRETQDYVKKITGSSKPAAKADPLIYKWMEIVNGEPRLRYSTTPPRDQAYEIVGKR